MVGSWGRRRFPDISMNVETILVVRVYRAMCNLRCTVPLMTFAETSLSE